MNSFSPKSVEGPHERKMRRSPHRYDLIALDFVLLNAAFYLAALITYDITAVMLPWRNLMLFLFVNTIWGILSLRYQAYRWYEKTRIELQLKVVLKILLFHFAILTLVYYYILNDPPTSAYIFQAYGLSLIFISTGRILNRVQESKRVDTFRYVIVGGQPHNFKELRSAFAYTFQGAAELVGRFGTTHYPGMQNIGGYNDILPYLRTQPNVHKLIVFYNKMDSGQDQEMFRICQEQFIDIEIAPRQTTIFPRGYEAQQHGDMTIFTLKQEPLMLLRNKFAKRAFDIAFSLGVLIFIFPLMFLIVAVLIKLESSGPVFFRQERSGYRNEVFKMWKFRTMAVNKESDTTQAKKGDRRVTRIGSFLRKTSLDEFPQFINVLRGDMSVVGPRPHMLAHTKEYAALIKPYMLRHKIKPGVTGWAQINGFRGPTDELWKMEKRVEYDVWYFENWSILLDVRCIVFTLLNAIRGEENAL